jgi:hypothetical protein
MAPPGGARRAGVTPSRAVGLHEHAVLEEEAAMIGIEVFRPTSQESEDASRGLDSHESNSFCTVAYYRHQQERLRLTLRKETSAGPIGQQFLSYNLIRAQKNVLESFFEVWAWPVTSRRSAYRRRDERAKK